MKEMKKTKGKGSGALRLAVLVAVFLAMIPAAASAQTGLGSTTNYNDLPVNYVKVEKLAMDDARFTTTNTDIMLISGWQTAEENGGGNVKAVIFNGVPNWGTANTTHDADAKMTKTTVPGTFTLRWTDAATLPDGTKADVLYTFSDWTFWLGEKPDSFSASAKVDVPVLAGTTSTSYTTYNPRKATSNTAGLATTIKQSIKTTVTIVDSGTETPVDSKYDSLMIRFLDLDVIDHSIATGKTAAERFAGSYSEGIGLVSGWKSPIYRTSDTSTVIDTVGGNQKVRGTKAADGTISSGFIGCASPQGYSYIWYGSLTATEASSGSNMATGISKGPEVSVYATAGKGGSIEKPGETQYILNARTTYDYAPDRGYKVKSLKVNGSNVSFDEDGGTYTFAKLIERSSSYDHTIDVQFSGPSVTYEWKGDHPDKKLPAGGEVAPGEYTVDTTYKKGDKVSETDVTVGDDEYPRGTWTFGGWDKDPVIEVYEDTVIKGAWSFLPEWNIEAAAVNGTIEGAEENIPDGETRTVTYEPDEGYQLKSLAVDGEEEDVAAYPTGYTFRDISADHRVEAVFEKTPALSIEKTSDKDHCNAGDIITYTVKVKQTESGAEARDVVITDSIPEGMKLVTGSIEGDGLTVEEESERAYRISYERLGEAEYTYKCRTDEDIDTHGLINTVTAAGSNVPEQATDESSVDSHVPAVTLVKDVDKSEADPGEEIVYTIKVRQDHEGAELRNAVFTDVLPEGIAPDENSLEVTGGDAGSASLEDGVITMEVEKLDEGFDVSFRAVIDEDAEGTVVNTASVDGFITEEQKLPAPVEDTAVTEVIPPEKEPEQEPEEEPEEEPEQEAAPVKDEGGAPPAQTKEEKPEKRVSKPVRTGDEQRPQIALAAMAVSAAAGALLMIRRRKAKRANK